MSQSLFRFAVWSIVLASGSLAWAQGSPDRAYPMNVLDRINGLDSGGYVASSDDDRPIGAAGAYPMNTIDRINSGWRNSNTVRTGAAAVTPSLKDRPDAWRYRWHENRWWYYGTNNHWLFWTGNHWNAFQSASAVDRNAH